MKKYISPCSLFFGVLTLAASIFIGYYVVPFKVWEKVTEQSKLVRGSTRFKSWESLPVPLFQNIYFFNVTNSKEVVLGGKPILQEVGPYVYQQRRQKFDIVFNENNDTVFYKESTLYFFRSDLSNGSESDILTVVNVPYVGTAHKASTLGQFERYMISDTLSKYPELQLYVTTTVSELLFKGTHLPFMKELSELKGEEVLPNNTFGLYYGKNGSDAGRFEIYTGVKYPEKFGNVVSWNGMSQLDWWNDEYCNRMNGSNGAMFQPFATKDRTFDMFIPGLCKSFRFTFESDGIDVKGVPVLKFSLPPSFFESAKTNPDNHCYCSNPGENFENCPENGVFQLENCGKGAMALSQPHFYQGSQFYLNQSVGLHPNKERHEMALYLEPYTSSPAKMNLRFQMNIDLKPNKFFKPLKKIPRMVHPIFWIDQTVEIPDDSAVLLREKLYGTINAANLLTHIGIIIGGVLIILSLLLFFLCSSNSSVPDGESKIECVSYNPQGTLQNGKVSLNAEMNGKICNGQAKYNNHVQNDEVSPLLVRNDMLPTQVSEQFSSRVGSLPSSQNDVTEGVANNQSNGFLKTNNTSQQLSPQSVQPISGSQPDSRLSPFPSSADYSSSLSIPADNTLRELVDATSSYENL